MQETTFVIGKRAYANEHAAMKALKKFERQVAKRIMKAKQHSRYDHED